MTRPEPLSRIAPHSVLVMTGLVVVLLILAAGLGWHLTGRGLRVCVTDATEAANRTLTRVFVNENWDVVKPLLPPSGSKAEEAKANPNIEAIDQIVRRFSSYTDVVKVKIYDRGGTTVYSSDRAQIGEDKSRNAGFLSAARGQVASELNYRGAFGAFDGEIYDRNLVSTYVPVKLGDEIEAVLEIYADRTESLKFLNEELRRLALAAGPWVVFALVVVLLAGWALHRAVRASRGGMEAAAETRSDEEPRPTPGEVQAPLPLPRCLEGLDTLLERFAGAAGTPAQAARDPDLAELLSRLGAISRWAEVQRALAGLRERAGRPAPAPVDLDSLVREVLEDTGRDAARRGSPVTVTDSRHPSPMGQGSVDGALLRVLLHHLIGASIDALPGTTGAVRVQCKFLREGGRLHVDVVDDSAGVPQARIDQWVEDWERGRILPGNDEVGLVGARLLIVRAMALQQGGQFSARSTPGHGNRWSLDLPVPSLAA